MAEADEPVGETFAQRLNWLFLHVTDPAGKPYSVRHVANELTRRGFKISHTHLSNLRQGRTPDPRRSVVDAIAAFFGQPPSFFAEASEDQHEQRLVRALNDPHIKQVAMRLIDARLSPEGHAAVVAMIEQVQRLETAARGRLEGAERQRRS
ncbi:hypothetical protein ACFY3U_22630 [Micromonospora sp. NPDC000089]|uniref:hypothetical protein n=1 Tax=unclassified Micromonospora TaxID=2617518 RepID=UPI0036BE5ECB